MLVATCQSCSATGFTEDGSARAIADAVRCMSPDGSPKGSVHGCCATDGKSHEEHVEHVASTGDSTARPLTISVPPGSATLRAAGR